nr:MAG TPA: hypothetical protein [Caudoviricetes sp.]
MFEREAFASRSAFYCVAAAHKTMFIVYMEYECV